MSVVTREQGYVDATTLLQPVRWDRAVEAFLLAAEAVARMSFNLNGRDLGEFLRDVHGCDPGLLWQDFGEYWEGYYEGDFHRFQGRRALGAELQRQRDEAYTRYISELHLLRRRVTGLFPQWVPPSDPAQGTAGAEQSLERPREGSPIPDIPVELSAARFELGIVEAEAQQRLAAMADMKAEINEAQPFVDAVESRLAELNAAERRGVLREDAERLMSLAAATPAVFAALPLADVQGTIRRTRPWWSIERVSFKALAQDLLSRSGIASPEAPGQEEVRVHVLLLGSDGSLRDALMNGMAASSEICAVPIASRPPEKGAPREVWTTWPRGELESLPFDLRRAIAELSQAIATAHDRLRAAREAIVSRQAVLLDSSEGDSDSVAQLSPAQAELPLEFLPAAKPGFWAHIGWWIAYSAEILWGIFYVIILVLLLPLKLFWRSAGEYDGTYIGPRRGRGARRGRRPRKSSLVYDLFIRPDTAQARSGAKRRKGPFGI